MFNGVWWRDTFVFLFQFEWCGNASAEYPKCPLCEQWACARCGLWPELRGPGAPLRALSVALRRISERDKQR